MVESPVRRQLHSVNRPGPFNGKVISVSHVEALRKYALSLEITGAIGARVSRGPSGTRIEVDPRRAVAQAGLVRCSFQASIEGDEITVARGFVKVIGGAVTEMEEATYTAADGYWLHIDWTYSTDEGPGAWGPFVYEKKDTSEVSDVLAEPVLKRVVPIFEVNKVGSQWEILQRHIGDIDVLDIIDRSACT